MEHAPRSKPERLPTIEVGNTVIWVNENMKAPFAMTLGESSRLGVLLALAGEEGAGFPGIPREGHWRTLDVGQAYFEDVDHRLYRDVDAKGTGLLAGGSDHFSGAEDPKEPNQWYANSDEGGNVAMNALGLLDKASALRDSELAEEFTALGMRTHRALGIIELEELNIGAERVPVAALREQKKLHPDFVPVVEARAFGVKTRAGDMLAITRSPNISGKEYITRLRTAELSTLLSAAQIERAKGEIEDALAFLQKEQKRSFSKTEYAHWFIQEVARNIGIMHNAGYIHQWLHAQNITLDARLTDFDDVLRLIDLEAIKELTPLEIEEDQNNLVARDINFHPDLSSRRGVLTWLEPYITYLKKLYPEDLKTVDPMTANTEFLESYLEQITDTKMRRIVAALMEESSIVPPERTDAGEGS